MTGADDRGLLLGTVQALPQKLHPQAADAADLTSTGLPEALNLTCLLKTDRYCWYTGCSDTISNCCMGAICLAL
jgi:hypothetical protein